MTLQYENSQLTGSTLYFVQLDAATGNGWNGSAYVTYTNTRSTFARTFTEISGTGLWQGTVGGTARYLRFPIFLQSGGSPSFADDVKIAETRYYWDGTTLMPQGPVAGSVTVGSIATNAITASAIADNAITANKIASSAFTAAKFASGALDSVWSATTRLLTAGTNIILAKGTGITGFNDLSTAQVNAEVDSAIADVGLTTGRTANLDNVDYSASDLYLIGLTAIELSNTVLARLGSWSTSGTNTVLGAFRALFRKAGASLPTDIGGTYDPATDSLEGIRDNHPANFSTLGINGSGHVSRVSLVDANSDYAAPPTAQQIRDAMKLAPSGGAAATNSIDEKIDSVESGGGGVIIPVVQIPVPATRTWILKHTDDGLRGELPIVRSVGEHQPFAVDFRNDLPNNGRLISLESIDFVGPDGGIVIDAEDRGVDRSQAKFVLQLLEAGTYVITLSVEYDDSDGGGTSIGSVTLIVK